MTRVEIERGLGDGTLVKGVTERTAEGDGDKAATGALAAARGCRHSVADAEGPGGRRQARGRLGLPLVRVDDALAGAGGRGGEGVSMAVDAVVAIPYARVPALEGA
jgi:hypothetical protein